MFHPYTFLKNRFQFSKKKLTKCRQRVLKINSSFVKSAIDVKVLNLPVEKGVHVWLSQTSHGFKCFPISLRITCKFDQYSEMCHVCLLFSASTKQVTRVQTTEKAQQKHLKSSRPPKRKSPLRRKRWRAPEMQQRAKRRRKRKRRKSTWTSRWT